MSYSFTDIQEMTTVLMEALKKWKLSSASPPELISHQST